MAAIESQSETLSPGNGRSTLHELFALTDEQILEIEPEAGEAAPVEQPLLAVPERRPIENMQQSAQARVPVPHEPPAWLAAQMKDPWNGEAAKELWNGVQQAKQEAAAYRAAFAAPEDALALKELYPGGVNEARAAANRARLLDDIDRAYFGAASSTPEQTTAARAQLAQMMLREDPAAFREMVFAGLRALEEAGVAAGFSPPSNASHVGATLGSPAADGGKASAGAASPVRTSPSVVGARHAVPASIDTSVPDAHAAGYAAFEKAANEDLERSVGAAISRTIEQALPVAQPLLAVRRHGETQAGAPALHKRLGAAVRQDVEAALKGDRQLGEQIAQILSARRFDNETRAQVVRLIAERAQQLVPVAAKRVLNDWTQTTLAAHRSNATRADTASARREVAPASIPASPPHSSQTSQSRLPAASARPDTRRIDYRKLSDEQILDL